MFIIGALGLIGIWSSWNEVGLKKLCLKSVDEELFAEYLDLYIPRPDIFLELKLELALVGLR